MVSPAGCGLLTASIRARRGPHRPRPPWRHNGRIQFENPVQHQPEEQESPIASQVATDFRSSGNNTVKIRVGRSAAEPMPQGGVDIGARQQEFKSRRRQPATSPEETNTSH